MNTEVSLKGLLRNSQSLMVKKRVTIKRLTLSQVELVAHSLAAKMMEWEEPIPDLSTRYPAILESCLATPFQTYDGKSLYRGIIGKSSILFYLMIKNHPFQNGNKRVAVMALFYFLATNGWWIGVTNDDLYCFAVTVAKSDPKDQEKEIQRIRSFIRTNYYRDTTLL